MQPGDKVLVQLQRQPEVFGRHHIDPGRGKAVAQGDPGGRCGILMASGLQGGVAAECLELVIVDHIKTQAVHIKKRLLIPLLRTGSEQQKLLLPRPQAHVQAPGLTQHPAAGQRVVAVCIVLPAQAAGQCQGGVAVGVQALLHEPQ